MKPEQIKHSLGMLDVNHPFLKALEFVVAEAVESETHSAVMPGLTDSARQYNAGRLAAMRDFAEALKAELAEARHAVSAG